MKNILVDLFNLFISLNIFFNFKGNPNDGIHLSRRPDVLLASTGSQGLLKFGLLVCKVWKFYKNNFFLKNKFFSSLDYFR